MRGRLYAAYTRIGGGRKRISQIEVKEVDERISRVAGRIKCRVSTVSLADALLAAAAKIFDVAVVTTDEDFREISGLRVIVLGI